MYSESDSSQNEPGNNGPYLRTMSLSKMEWTSGRLLTPQPVQISTVFLVNFTFSGTYSQGCGLTFNIWDSQLIYHLDLRLNYKGDYKKLTQTYKYLGKWMSNRINEDLELREGKNSMKVKVGTEFFNVWVNGKKFLKTIQVDTDRLHKYSHVSLDLSGTCTRLNLDESTVQIEDGE